MAVVPVSGHDRMPSVLDDPGGILIQEPVGSVRGSLIETPPQVGYRVWEGLFSYVDTEHEPATNTTLGLVAIGLNTPVQAMDSYDQERSPRLHAS